MIFMPTLAQTFHSDSKTKILKADGTAGLLWCSCPPKLRGNLWYLFFSESLRDLSDSITKLKELLVGHVIWIRILPSALLNCPLQCPLFLLVRDHHGNRIVSHHHHSHEHISVSYNTCFSMQSCLTLSPLLLVKMQSYLQRSQIVIFFWISMIIIFAPIRLSSRWCCSLLSCLSLFLELFFEFLILFLKPYILTC